MICAFTGHRPEKLPWGTREGDPRCEALKRQIRLAVERAAREAWLPCEGQPDRWPRQDRDRYEGLLSRCDRVILVEREYSEGCMLRRNRAMLDRADRLISVYSGGGGGTGQAVAYAKSRGLFIDALWL